MGSKTLKVDFIKFFKHFEETVDSDVYHFVHFEKLEKVVLLVPLYQIGLELRIVKNLVEGFELKKKGLYGSY